MLETKKSNKVAQQHINDIGAGGCWATQGVENPHANLPQLDKHNKFSFYLSCTYRNECNFSGKNVCQRVFTFIVVDP